MAVFFFSDMVKKKEKEMDIILPFFSLDWNLAFRVEMSECYILSQILLI